MDNGLTNNPENIHLRFLKGLILVKQGALNSAISMFQHITESHPDLPEPHNNLAVIMAQLGDYEAAIKRLEAAMKTHPSYSIARENLGDVYAMMARDAYDKALKYINNPENYYCCCLIFCFRNVF